MATKLQLSEGAAEESRDPDFTGAEIALRRAANRARQRAINNIGAVAVFRDGKVVWEKPDGTTDDELDDSRKGLKLLTGDRQ